MQFIIFDLDGSLIDSSHRYLSLPDGGIDLDYWIKNNTAENCAKDKLLPLVRTLRRDARTDATIIICTARVLSSWDYEFFMENDIPFHHMLDRPSGCTLPDTDLKEFNLRWFAHQSGIPWERFCKKAVFFEDAKCVLTRMKEIGIPTIDAAKWNKRVSPLAA